MGRFNTKLQISKLSFMYISPQLLAVACHILHLSMTKLLWLLCNDLKKFMS